MSEIRTRFAPSPTGLFHVGSARTALFAWLFARHHGGKLILRIEDTDEARNSKEANDAIFNAMEWLGLDWDEGPYKDGSTKGDFGPYFQSQRKDIYNKYVEKLLSEGKAFEHEGAVKVKLNQGEQTYQDLVCGNVTRELETPDLVIRRKDGTCIFHLVNVVDDIEMKITHVIRGEDHIANTFKHLRLYELLGVPAPKFGHLPMILNPDGSKMSKRDQGARIGDYIEEGYIPEAFVNYMCLLGWSMKDDREIFPMKDVIEKFDLDQIHRSNAKFDFNRLYWLNGEYWTKLSEEDYLKRASDYLKLKNVAQDADQAYLKQCLLLVRNKIKLARDLPKSLEPYLSEDLNFDLAKEELSTPEKIQQLGEIKNVLSKVSDFTALNIESSFKEYATSLGVKAGTLMHPARIAVTGLSTGSSFYPMLEVLGKDRTLKRIDRTLDHIATQKV
jgi:glutamyl-tRNA synthetase